MTIGERITKVLKDKSLSQQIFAKKLGTSQSTISRLKKGGTPSGKLVRKLSEVFGVNPDWLLNEKGEQYRPVETIVAGMGIGGQAREVPKNEIREHSPDLSLEPRVSYVFPALTEPEIALVDAFLALLKRPQRSSPLEIAIGAVRLVLSQASAINIDTVQKSGPSEPDQKENVS